MIKLQRRDSMRFICENKFMIGVMILLISIVYSAATRNIDYEKSTITPDNVVMQTR
jgi:hypothetical protein